MSYYLPKRLRVPGVCQGCAGLVVYDGKRWTDTGTRRPHAHRCRVRKCGVWMPKARTSCARPEGIHNDHRSQYALANAREHRARGVTAA